MNEVELIYQFIKSNGANTGLRTMIDVGAHYGGSLKRFAEDGWKIFALEPDPKNRERLLQSIEKFVNVDVDTRAIGEQTGDVLPFYQSDVSSGISGLSSFHTSHRSHFNVETIRLDDFCNEKNIDQIDFLKIDTEGFDYFVLKSNDWSQIQPEYIICEFENRKTIPLGYRFRDIANYLIEQGYTVFVSEWYPIVEYGMQHTWRSLTKYPCDLGDNNGWGNLIALKSSDLAEQFQLASEIFTSQQRIINKQHIMIENRERKIKNLTESNVVRHEEFIEPIVFYYPFFSTLDDLNDHIARACWYLSVIDFREIYFFCDENLDLSGFEFEVPDYLDPSILGVYEEIRDKIHVLNASDTNAPVKVFRSADLVMHWDLTTHPSSIWKQAFEKEVGAKQRWRVDNINERYEGSFYIKAGLHPDNYPEKEADVEECKARLMELAHRLGKKEKSYLFATGPSIDKYPNYNFDDGLRIICNSVIFDDELVKYVNPEMLVFGDPIFHFGCNLYAKEYREKLLDVVGKYDLPIMIPFNYYRLFTHYFPELKERCVGVPLESGKGTNLNLNHQFYIETTGNILTNMMIPLAATFSNHIHILGCDGRKLKEDDYYWKHNKKTQITSKMANIKTAHPSFFDIDFNEYNTTHRDVLDKWITLAESRGKKFDVLTPSYLPALRKRYTYLGEEYENDFYPSISIVIPYRNAGSTIQEALDSVFEDNYPRLDVIIVNNGSNEENREILYNIAGNDSRIKVIDSDKNGVSNARNTGMLAAESDYIGFLDADDVFCDGSIHLRMQHLIDFDHDAVYCPTEIVDGNKDHLSWITSKNRKTTTFLNMDGCPFHCNALFLKSEFIPKYALFDPTIANGEDWDFFQRLARCGVVFNNVPDAMVKYVQTSEGTVFSDYNAHLNKLNFVLDKVYSVDDCSGHALDEYRDGFGAAHMRYRMNKRLWQGVLWNILAGKQDEAQQIADKMWPHLTSAITTREIEEMSRWLVSRYYQCDINQWRDMLGGQLERVVEEFIEKFDAAKYSNLIMQIDSVFGRSSKLEQSFLNKGKHTASMKDKSMALLRRDQTIAEKNQALAEKNFLILEKNSALKRRDLIIEAKNEALQAKTALINEKNEAISRRDGVINEKNEALRAKTALINEKNEAISRRDDVINEKNEAISRRDGVIEAKNLALEGKGVHLNTKSERFFEESGQGTNSRYSGVIKKIRRIFN